MSENQIDKKEHDPVEENENEALELWEWHEQLADIFDVSIGDIKKAFPEERYQEAAYYAARGKEYKDGMNSNYRWGTVSAVVACGSFLLGSNGAGAEGVFATLAFSTILTPILAGCGINHHLKYNKLKKHFNEHMKQAKQENAPESPFKNVEVEPRKPVMGG